MTDGVQADLERVRSDAIKELLRHEIECERRYGEINGRLDKQEALMGRNTWLLYVILIGMLAVAGRAFWPTVFGG